MTSRDKKTFADGWPQAGDFRKSIRLEFSLYLAAIVLALMLVTGYITTEQYARTVSRDVVEKLLVQARAYSGPAGKHMLAAETPDALMLNNICRKLDDDNPDVYWSGITAGDNIYLAHSDIRQVVANAPMPSFPGQQFTEIRKPGEEVLSQSDTIFIAIPIMENGITLGRLGVAASTRQITEARNTSIITVATTTLAMILLGIPLAMLLVHRKLRPISTITDTLKQVDFEDLAIDIPINNANEFGYLAETLHVMGARLNVARKESIEKDRIARELEIARDIQANILPRTYPVDDCFEFSGTYRSAREVGGDYYDFIDIDENRFAFLVADVSGKSLPGMLVMLLTRDIVRRVTRSICRPADVLSQVNRELAENIKKGMFVTMFYGLLDKRTGLFQFASAGHNPLVVFHASHDKPELLNPKGYPLGMMPEQAFDNRIASSELTLSVDDWLVQYTDGVNEAQNLDKQEYGMDRFLNTLISFRDRSAKELVEGTVAQLESFVGAASQYDDITLLAMKWRGTFVDTSNTGNKKAVYAD